jgi:secreted PhoX family phosphatase
LTDAGSDPAALRFAWNMFVKAGDPANADVMYSFSPASLH